MLLGGKAGPGVNGLGSCVQGPRRRTVRRRFSLHVGKADENEFADTRGQGHRHKVAHILHVGRRQKRLRARTEQDSGKVDNAIYMLADPGKRFGAGEVCFRRSHVRGFRDVQRHRFLVNQKPELVVVDVEPARPLARPIPLSELKQDPVLGGMSFVKMPRVAVWPVTEEQWVRVLEVSGTRS